MKKYAQESCPKCGSSKFQHEIKWHLNSLPPEESLSIRCGICSYSWQALPMDAKIEDEDTSILPSS